MVRNTDCIACFSARTRCAAKFSVRSIGLGSFSLADTRTFQHQSGVVRWTKARVQPRIKATGAVYHCCACGSFCVKLSHERDLAFFEPGLAVLALRKTSEDGSSGPSTHLLEEGIQQPLTIIDTPCYHAQVAFLQGPG